MRKTDRITVKEAASILGMSAQGVKEHMKRGLFDPPIGHVTQVSNRKQYHIYRNQVERYVSANDPEESVVEVKEMSAEEKIGDIVLKAIQQIMQVAMEAPKVI